MKIGSLKAGLVFAMLVAVSANAQQTYIVKGALIDSVTSQPIAFATVTAYQIPKNTLINGAISKSEGGFSMNLPAGNYKLVFSFVGYKTKEIIIDFGNEPEKKLGTIKLIQSATTLSEVVVSGQKSSVEQKVDRLVYNPDSNISSSGGDASDVLKNVPLLAVDLNGNLYLKGSQNLKLLINDKPSAIAIISIADALKQIPADQIKSVEVMTSPSSKYDAEGAAGIVNIVLKKGGELSSLSSNGSFEVRGSKLTLNGSLKKQRMIYSGSAFINYSYNHPGSFSNSQTTTDSQNNTSTIFQHANTNFNSLRNNYSFNWDFDINERNSISSSVTYFNSIDHAFQDKLHTWNPLGDISLKDVKNDGNGTTVAATVNYQHLFAKPKREFSVMALFNQGNNNNSFLSSFLSPADYVHLGYQKNLNNYVNQEVTVQADFQTPLSRAVLMEIGGKGIARTVSSNYQYLNSGTDNVFTPVVNPYLSNSLSYSQNVRAGYLSFDWAISKKYEMKAGLRYEDTFIAANFGDQQNIRIPSYSVLVPSFNLMKKVGKANSIKLSYNRRIQRPSVQYLNPNVQAQNPLAVIVGSPSLSPEFTDNIDLSYSAGVGRANLTLSGFVQSTNNAIQTVRSIQGADTIRTTYKNTGKQNSIGVNFSGDFPFSNKLSITSNLDLTYSVITGDDPIQNKTISNSGMSHHFSISGRYKVSDKVKVELMAFNFGNTYSLQGFSQGWSIFNLSLKKDLKDKRGNIGFTAGNFIPGYIVQRSSVNSPFLQQQTAREVQNLNFKVFFTYQLIRPKKNFGSKLKKSIDNSDLKTATDQN
ncbi:MAG TPA: TonB-dependent receptor [Cyclobacteriaceae bacterium]|jgi:outer membrane receptor protein involved in Fe transport|nr:TonB-dependent receptor [Cyclobacteriaceae bacterium]